MNIIEWLVLDARRKAAENGRHPPISIEGEIDTKPGFSSDDAKIRNLRMHAHYEQLLKQVKAIRRGSRFPQC